MFVQFFSNAGAGIVVKNIDVAEAVERRFDHAVAVFLFSDVDGCENGLPAFFVFNQLVNPRRNGFLDIAANHLGAFAGEKPRGGPADAAISTGDDRDFVLEPAQAGPQHFMLVFQDYFRHDFRLLIGFFVHLS